MCACAYLEEDFDMNEGLICACMYLCMHVCVVCTHMYVCFVCARVCMSVSPGLSIMDDFIVIRTIPG